MYPEFTDKKSLGSFIEKTTTRAGMDDLLVLRDLLGRVGTNRNFNMICHKLHV